MIYYVFAFTLIGLGLFAIMFKKNLFKIVIGIELMTAGVNLLFIAVGFVVGGTAPIFEESAKFSGFVDPVPQALILTSIVIGAASVGLASALALRAGSAKGGDLDVH
ncbi:cation:proton antiporter subunit C [Coprothermobacteraceae bacterium]|nr:cation:proton antiporter subunit C [Coprothermobacteraceae bacterium]